MKKYMVLAVFAMIAIMALGMLNTGAWFTDNATSATSSIYAGTLSIADGKLSKVSLGTIANLAPGDIIGKEVKVVIENNGNIPLAWFGDIHFEGNDQLKSVLYIEEATMEYSWQDPHYVDFEYKDPFIREGRGYGPDPDWYDGLVDPNFGVITFETFDNTSGMGSSPYEFIGALKPGEFYILTLKFGMVKQADNTYQGLGPVDVSFEVDATQVNKEAINTEIQTPYGTNLFSWFELQIAKQ